MDPNYNNNPYVQQPNPQDQVVYMPPEQQLQTNYVVQTGSPPPQQFQPPPQQVSFVQTTTTSSPPPQYIQPQPEIVVVTQRRPMRGNREGDIIAAWVLFAIGFFCPLLWCIGAMYIRSPQPAAKVGGILNLVFGLSSIVVIILVIALVIVPAAAIVGSAAPNF